MRFGVRLACAVGWSLAVAVCVAPVAAFAQAAQVTTLATGYSAPQFVTVNGDKTVFVTDTTYSLSALFLVNGAYTTTPMAYDTNFVGAYIQPSRRGRRPGRRHPGLPTNFECVHPSGFSSSGRPTMPISMPRALEHRRRRCAWRCDRFPRQFLRRQ